MAVNIKRIYTPASGEDGFRVLVDRLWPRGVSKEEAKLDLWLKEIAPSNELREWFGHDPAKWAEFEKRYIIELNENPETVDQLREILKKNKRVTLLYGARDETHNEAVVLQKYIHKS
ncbi:DUF488 domain-containing protein [Candidatus Saccharibacteria bacterium]|nr:DUF488 domain-containing protein [Candidatus Saccharibacteria bacterium]